MAAAVLVKPGCFEFREAPIPVPGPGQVCIRLEGCGVDAASVAAWKGGDAFEYPLGPGAPGGEAWGRICETGEGVSGLAPGDRVAVLTQTGFAQYTVADASRVLALPDSLDELPFPSWPLAGAVNVFRRSFIEKGDTVAVVGFGFLGALITELAVLAEAKVVAVGRRPYALRLAKQLGASMAVVCKDAPEAARTVEVIREMNRGALCDVVIEAAGNSDTLDLAAQLTRERGRLVLAGTHRDGSRRVDMDLWNRRGFDVINAHEVSTEILREGLNEAASALDCGLIDPRPLYTHRFSLARLDDALRLAAERPPGFMKALVYF
jgi:threonine dehydrogenase-like Zn-dependent dehydrogenase